MGFLDRLFGTGSTSRQVPPVPPVPQNPYGQAPHGQAPYGQPSYPPPRPVPGGSRG